MTGSSKERQERIDALLDVVADRKRVAVPQLVTLAVRSWLVNRKTAQEYVDLLLQAGWVTLEGYDYLIAPAGRKHLMAVDDWPEPEERVMTRSQKARAAKEAVAAPPSPPSETTG